jgi:hypothetical protein
MNGWIWAIKRPENQFEKWESRYEPTVRMIVDGWPAFTFVTAGETVG